MENRSCRTDDLWVCFFLRALYISIVCWSLAGRAYFCTWKMLLYADPAVKRENSWVTCEGTKIIQNSFQTSIELNPILEIRILGFQLVPRYNWKKMSLELLCVSVFLVFFFFFWGGGGGGGQCCMLHLKKLCVILWPFFFSFHFDSFQFILCLNFPNSWRTIYL